VGWGASGLSICHADEGTLQTRQQPDSTHQSSNINSNSITKDQQGVVWRVAVAATAWGPGGKPRRMGSAWGRHGVSMGLAWGWHGVSMGLAWGRMGLAWGGHGVGMGLGTRIGAGANPRTGAPYGPLLAR
jgi:hypothetical protein